MKEIASALLLALALATSPALADPPAASPAGCFGQSNICVGPSVAVGLLGYNLVTHSVSIGALPVGAAGLEVSAFSSQWYRTGLSVNLALVAQQSGANSITVAPILSFAKYARIGAMLQTVGESAQWTLIGGLGLTGSGI
jgi:hypothetical protein